MQQLGIYQEIWEKATQENMRRVAVNLLSEGISINLIARVTGLSIEQVQQLQQIGTQNLEESEPWVKFAGMFRDDPLFDEFVEDMASYRQSIITRLCDSRKSASGHKT